MLSVRNHRVVVEVTSQYVPARSRPHRNEYFFAYHVTIRNDGDEAVQLLTRHWTIVNATGHTEEVHGPGVVGEQPRLAPGESFRYTSFCPLPTQVGSMHGSYEMVADGGRHFSVAIAPFTLALPHALN